MAKYLIWAGAAGVTIVLAVVVYLVLFPGVALTRMQDHVARVTGRSLMVAGDAHLELAPALALRLDEVTLANPPGMDGYVLRAAAIRVPLSFAELFGRSTGGSVMTLVEPRFNLLIDGQGQANWLIPGGLPAVSLALENAEIAFLDLRNGQAFKIGGLNAAAALSEAGELSLEGVVFHSGAFGRFQAYVKSPARIAGDGSPVDLALEAPVLKAAFSGRLAAASSLGLAGQISLSGSDLRRSLAWAGVTLGGSRGFKAFAVNGGLDSQGKSFSVNNAEVTLDGLAAKGRVGLDLSLQKPVILADLTAGRIDSAGYLGPTVTADWDSRPLGLEKLTGLDAQFSLRLDDLLVRGYATGPAHLNGRLAAGGFTLALEAEKLKSELTLDADGMGLDVQMSGAVLDWLEGETALSLKVSGTGRSEQDIISTLQGEAEISAGKGSLRGIDVQATVGRVSAAVQEGWPRNGATPFDTAQAKFAIADGIATAAELRLGSPALSLTGTGEIDILRRALDLEFQPRLVTGTTSSAALPVAIAVRGPWAAPRIFPDLPDILIDPEAAYQALKAMGMPETENN